MGKKLINKMGLGPKVKKKVKVKQLNYVSIKFFERSLQINTCIKMKGKKKGLDVTRKFPSQIRLDFSNFGQFFLLFEWNGLGHI